jgi:hypothetical protein
MMICIYFNMKFYSQYATHSGRFRKDISRKFNLGTPPDAPPETPLVLINKKNQIYAAPAGSVQQRRCEKLICRGGGCSSGDNARDERGMLGIVQ